MNTTKFAIAAALTLAAAGLIAPALAADPGVSDTEIKIGNVTCETGWLSEYNAATRAEAAYFQFVNDQGGIHGRKIKFVSLDCGSDMHKAGQLTRKLVEDEQVFLIFNSQGVTASLALRPYLNDRKIPQLFVMSPTSKLNDPAKYPYTMGFQPSGRIEGNVFAKYILKTKPAGKIAVLHAHDDVSDDLLAGLREGLGDKAMAMIVADEAYDDHDTDLASHLDALKHSGADVFCNFTTGKFTTQAIGKSFDMGWRPLQMVPTASLSVAAFLDPAGLDKSKEIISCARSKGWSDEEAAKDPDVKAFLDWMKKYNPTATTRDQLNLYGYEAAETMTAVLQKCGDDLTRKNVIKQASHLDLTIGMLLPGIKVTTTPTDYRPIHQLYLVKFDGKKWEKFGDVVGE